MPCRKGHFRCSRSDYVLFMLGGAAPQYSKVLLSWASGVDAKNSAPPVSGHKLTGGALFLFVNPAGGSGKIHLRAVLGYSPPRYGHSTFRQIFADFLIAERGRSLLFSDNSGNLLLNRLGGDPNVSASGFVGKKIPERVSTLSALEVFPLDASADCRAVDMDLLGCIPQG